jgi:hypothetical protein
MIGYYAGFRETDDSLSMFQFALPLDLLDDQASMVRLAPSSLAVSAQFTLLGAASQQFQAG